MIRQALRGALAVTFAAAAAGAGIAAADARLDYESKPGGTSSILVSGQRAAVGDGDTAMLFQEGEEGLTMVDHRQKTFTVMDAAALQSIAAQRSAMAAQMGQLMKQMESQLAAMPAEQRAMVEQMLKQQMGAAGGAPAPAPARSVTALGEATVGSWRCQRYQLREGDRPVQELCVAAPAALGIGEADAKTLRAAMLALSTLAVHMGGGPEMGDLRQIEGIPVQVTRLDTGYSSVLRAVSSDAVPAGRLQVPADYRPLALSR